MYCSTSVINHVLRGICACALIGLGLYLFRSNSLGLVVAIGSFIGAMVLLRGCPMCWLMGLLDRVKACKAQQTNKLH